MDSKIDMNGGYLKSVFFYNDIYIYIIAKLSFVFLCKYDYDNLDLSWDMR